MCLHTCITVSRWLIAPVHKALGNTARHWGGKDKDLFWRKYLSASTRFASGQSDHSSMASNSWAGAGSRHSNFGWPSPLLINSGINSHTLRPKRTGYTLSPHVKGKPVLEIGNNKPVKPQPTNIISSKNPFSKKPYSTTPGFEQWKRSAKTWFLYSHWWLLNGSKSTIIN